MKKLFCILLSVLCVMTAVMPVVAAAKPSVSLQEPELAEKEYVVNGTKVEAPGAIFKEDGSIAGVIDDKSIVVTPSKKTDEAKDESVKLLLTEAAKDVADNTVVNSQKDTLNELAKTIYPTLDAEDLAVRDLVDVSLEGEIAEIYQPDGSLMMDGKPVTIDVTLDVALTDKDVTPLITFQCKPGDPWVTIDPSRVKRNPDNTLTVTFDKFCAIATLTPSAKAIEENPELKSPSTGIEDMTRNYPMAAISLTASLVLIGAMALLKKKVK